MGTSIVEVSTERTERRDADARRVAEGIRHAIEEGRYRRNARLPSERMIASEFGVTRRAVRRAIEILERQGLVYRIERTGAFVRGAVNDGSAGAHTVRAITFIEDFWPVPRERQFALADYLAAYTEVLDATHVRMRFEPHLQRYQNFEQVLADQFPLQEQACILVNIAPPDLMKWLDERRIPYVVQFYCDYPCDGLPPHHRVFVNKFRGAYDAVRYLVSLGHRRIGFVGKTGEPGDIGMAYHAAMRYSGLLPARADILDLATDNVEVAYDPALEFLRRNRRITAVFAQADAMALALMRAAKTLGIRVPDDLSVVGFNDQPEAAQTEPPLTTVASPRRLLARRAVEMLLAVVRGECDSWQELVLDCNLVVRKSTAPPRTAKGGD